MVFDPRVITYDTLLGLFWQNYDPTQGMRQGGDVGTQYRSALFPQDDAQREAARANLAAFAQAMAAADDDHPITTALEAVAPFYYAEDEHQQYLHKHPDGYCALGGIGVCLPPAR